MIHGALEFIVKGITIKRAALEKDVEDVIALAAQGGMKNEGGSVHGVLVTCEEKVGKGGGDWGSGVEMRGVDGCLEPFETTVGGGDAVMSDGRGVGGRRGVGFEGGSKLFFVHRLRWGKDRGEV